MNTKDKHHGGAHFKQHQTHVIHQTLDAAIDKGEITKVSFILKKEEFKGRKVKYVDDALKKCVSKYSKKSSQYYDIAKLLLTYTTAFSYHKKTGGIRNCVFMSAVKANKIKMIQLFLKISKKSEIMAKVLQIAVMHCIRHFEEGNAKYTKILNNIIILSKISLNFEDEDCCPPLQMAVSKQKVQLVKILLKGKCDVNYKNSKNGNAALHLASHKNNEEIVRLLLAYNASVMVQNSKKMVPNGFTTSMKIMNLLNDKAQELTMRANVDAQRRGARGSRDQFESIGIDNSSRRQYTLRARPSRPGRQSERTAPRPLNGRSERAAPQPLLSTAQSYKEGFKVTAERERRPKERGSREALKFASQPLGEVANSHRPYEIGTGEGSSQNTAKNTFKSYAVSNKYSLRGANSMSSMTKKKKKRVSKLNPASETFKNYESPILTKPIFNDLSDGVSNDGSNFYSNINRGYISEPDIKHHQNQMDNLSQMRAVKMKKSPIEPPQQPRIYEQNLRFNKNSLNERTPGDGDDSLSPQGENQEGEVGGSVLRNARASEPISPKGIRGNQQFSEQGPFINYEIPGSFSQPRNADSKDQVSFINQKNQIKELMKRNAMEDPRGSVPDIMNPINNLDDPAGRRGDRPMQLEASYRDKKEEMKQNLVKLSQVLEDRKKTETDLLVKRNRVRKEIQELKAIVDQKQSNINNDQSQDCYHCTRVFNLEHSELRYTNKIEAILHGEVLMFEEQVKELNEDQRHKDGEIVSLMDDIVKSVLPDAKLRLYGSFATNLYLPWSDIDIVLNIENERCPSSYEALSAIEAALLERSDLFPEVKYISNAAFPVIKIVCCDKYMNKKLDITLQEEKHNGLNCVDLVKEYLVQYEGLLRPLVYITKQIIYMANLSDPYQGGLSSYGLILMLVSLFQWNIHRKTATIEDMRNNLGKTLLEFLNLYGNILDYNLNEVHPNLPNEHNDNSPYQRSSRVYNMNNGYITVMSPLNKTNNVTRATSKFYVIRMIFSYAYLSVNQPCSCDIRALLQKSKANGRPPSLVEVFDEKLSLAPSASKEKKWKVLVKILNAYKSPIFYVYTMFQNQNT